MLANTQVDCKDMSAVVYLFTRLTGGSTVQVRRVDGPFDYKKILPIEHTTWVSNSWSHHQFGWFNGKVYDACVQLNETSPYVPAGDDLDAKYKPNLWTSGAWNPQTPHQISDFY
jgi:hypothetical protein